MKVLYFHQHFSTPLGSTGTRSYEFARKLIELGHDVTMVCGSTAVGASGLTGEFCRGMRRGVVDGINVVEICLPYSNYDTLLRRSIVFLRYALKSIVFAFKENYDVLFATSTPLTAGIPGIVMKLLKPWKKFVFEVRDLWPELPKAMGVVKNPVILAGMSLLERASYFAMDGGVALSPGIKSGIESRCLKQKRVELIPNGCDLDLFKPKEGSGKNRLCSMSDKINQGDFVAIFTGAHGLANGLDAVLDAAALVLEDNPQIKLVFIGDGKLKPDLVERADQEGLVNCVFLDPVPKQQLSELMSEVDLGMMILNNIPAFYYGTSPNKFFDYISMGVPVLNNYPGWLADLILEHNCGLAVPPDSSRAFADALIKCAEKRDMCIEMGNNARELAEGMFDRNELSDRFVNFLEEVAGGK